MKDVPLLVQFFATMIIIIGSIEVGNYAGVVLQRRKKSEKDGMISVISGSILGLLSFILAFTFGNVSDRYDTRKALIRDEANQIGTVWLRTDFMEEPDRSASRELLRKYIDLRVGLLDDPSDAHIIKSLKEADKIQDQLWAFGKRHSQTDMKSDLGSLYFDALNKLIDLQGLRLAIGYRGHIAAGLWMSLYVLLVTAMFSVGYYASSIQSKRNLASILLAFSFSVVIWMISNLDRLQTHHFDISQQPIIDLRDKVAGQ